MRDARGKMATRGRDVPEETPSKCWWADTKVLALMVTVGNFSSDRIIGEDEGRPEDF